MWLLIVDLRGDRTSTIHKLHQRYGPAVVISPNEVSFSNVESVKEIYGQQTDFLKAPVYESLTLPPLGVFSLRDKALHSQRRRLLSHAFSQSNLRDSEPLIQEQILQLLQSIKVDKAVDALSLFRLTAFDVVGMFAVQRRQRHLCSRMNQGRCSLDKPSEA